MRQSKWFDPSPIARDTLQRLVRNESGASVIEFAAVLPIFMMFLLGIIAFGVYFGAAHGTAQLAADAARASVAGLDDAERESIARQHVTSSLSKYPLLLASKIEVTAGPSASDPESFIVQVNYQSSDLPIWSFSKLIRLPSSTILRTAVVKRGGY